MNLSLAPQAGPGDASKVTVASAPLVPPFDLGLVIHRHGLLSTVGEWFGSKDIVIGDPAFDRRFVVKGDEPARVQALLADRGLRAVLADLHRWGVHFDLNDSGIRIVTTGTASARWVERALYLSSRMAGAANAARPRVPVASVLRAHRALWHEYAESVGMTGMSTPLRMSGVMDGATVFVSTLRTGPLRYALEVRVQFEQVLEMGLDISPTSEAVLDSYFGEWCPTLGDPIFDQRFVVRAVRPRALEFLGTVIDEPVRNHILELSRVTGNVRVLDDAVILWAPALDTDPSTVPRVITQARSLARRIAENAARVRGSAQHGPFR